MRKNTSRMVGLCLMVCSLSLFIGCPVPGAKDIHRAAHEGDLEKVKQLIGSDPNQVNVQDSLGFTPLQLASGKGHLEVAEYLLEHGADVELGNSEGQKPLSLAAKFGHLETARILLEHGARVNSTDKFGDTALHDAALWSGREVVELLISYGAEVSAKNDSNDTPLHRAARQNNIEAAKALVEHGADIFAKNSYDFSKLDERHEMGDKEATEMWANFLIRTTKNKTPKEIAVEGGYTELAQYLQAKEDEKEKEEEEKGAEKPKEGEKERKEKGKDGSIKGRACFTADTRVWIDGMIVPISKVVAGQAVGRSLCATPGPSADQVETVEEHTGTFEYRDILLESGNHIGVVGDHYFMLDSGQWTAAQDLTSGTRLRTRTGTIAIKTITTRATPYTGRVYNLKVKDSEMYMVGEDAVIVRDY